MADLTIRMLLGVTFGLAFALLARRPARQLFGAAPAFTLWLLPALTAFAPLLPRSLAPVKVWTVPAIVVTARTAVTGPHAASGFPWMLLLVSLWLIGTAIALIRLSVHYARLLRGLAPMPAEWCSAISDVAPDLDPHRVRVHAAGPAVLWALRTRVLLPPDFLSRFDAKAQRLVLQHELTHVRRGDALWLLVAELAGAALWFHPLAWVALSRFRLDQELACDERTLRSLADDGSRYARTLLHSVAAQPLPVLIPWLAEPQLKERIAMISKGRISPLRRRTGFLVIVGCLCGGLLMAGGQTPASAATHARTTSTSPSVDVTKKNANPPRYPVAAIKNKQQGTVILDVTVDAAGHVKGVAVDQQKTNASPELQTAALQAAAGWTFHPGSKDGKAVGGTVQIPVTFSLGYDVKPCPSGQGHASKAPFQCVSLQAEAQSS